MKFTILSHAGLLVESCGSSVLIDPWLVGSCYWRSWFNFPEPDPELIDGLAPDWIYLTHLHWDHFHGPSLRRFPRRTPILVPRIPSPRMVRDLRRMGFADVREAPHGSQVELAPGFRLHSFQFGLAATDSIVVLQDAGTTLLDANDCKTFGLSLRQIKRRFPRIDFVLRSYSSAHPLPYCIEGYEERFGDLRTRDDYLEEFTAFARTMDARYAVPFASNHCFVHPETRRFNATAVLPDAVKAFMAAAPASPECVVMPAGSSYDHDGGFEVRSFDYGAHADYVERLARRHVARMAAQQQREASAVADFASFERYFRAFLKALCWPLRRLLPATVFEAQQAGRSKFWQVDFRGRRLEEVAAANPDHLQIATPALVLNDCCRKRMFSVWTPSKRLRIRLGKASIAQVQLLLQLFDLYENEQLPLRRLLTVRSLSIWLRRWREPLDLVRAFTKLGILRQPVRSLYHVPGPATRRARPPLPGRR